MTSDYLETTRTMFNTSVVHKYPGYPRVKAEPYDSAFYVFHNEVKPMLRSQARYELRILDLVFIHTVHLCIDVNLVIFWKYTD